MSVRGRALLAALVAAAGMALAAAPAQAATAVSVNGLTDHRGNLRPLARQHAQLIREAGIRIGRADAFWQWAEPYAPLLGLRSYDWHDFDGLAGLLAAHDIRWLPVLAYSTFWSSSVRGTDHAPPVDDGDYLAYAAVFAQRYGRGGSFWAERRDLEEKPVTAYEVWNEPNLAHFWLPKPDAARYARLYLAAREVLKGVDPDATVVMGGMHAYAFEYLEAMHAAEPSLPGAVDAFAYHPYGPDVEHVLKLVRKMRETLDRYGGARVPLWITELGWASQGAGAIPRAPDRTRAANLSLATDVMLGGNCGIELVNAYTWVTPETDPDHDDQWLGIYRTDGAPTESGHAYRESVARDTGAPRPPLRLCRGEQRNTGPAAKPLKLGIGLAAAGRGCVAATLTYRGRPLNGIVVSFSGAGKAADARTNIDGVARRCPGRAALGRRLKASARLLDVAASRTAALQLR